MSKAYLVTIRNGDFDMSFISGDTAGQARARAFKSLHEYYDNYRFVDVNVRRCYKYDSLCDKLTFPRGFEFCEMELMKQSL